MKAHFWLRFAFTLGPSMWFHVGFGRMSNSHTSTLRQMFDCFIAATHHKLIKYILNVVVGQTTSVETMCLWRALNQIKSQSNQIIILWLAAYFLFPVLVVRRVLSEKKKRFRLLHLKEMPNEPQPFDCSTSIRFAAFLSVSVTRRMNADRLVGLSTCDTSFAHRFDSKVCFHARRAKSFVYNLINVST